MFGSTWSFFVSREVSSAEQKIGERGTNGSIVHNISTIGNRTWFGCLPLPPPPLHKQISAVIWSSTSLSPLSHPCPPPPLPCAYNTEARRWFSRLASNSEVVSIIADIGQQQCLVVFFRLFNRVPISRDRDYCGLTEISEISGGRQRFGRRHFRAWRAGTSSRHGKGESPPITAGPGELIPHLETTFSRFNINKKENVLISRTREKSAVADSAKPKQ